MSGREETGQKSPGHRRRKKRSRSGSRRSKSGSRSGGEEPNKTVEQTASTEFLQTTNGGGTDNVGGQSGGVQTAQLTSHSEKHMETDVVSTESIPVPDTSETGAGVVEVHSEAHAEMHQTKDETKTETVEAQPPVTAENPPPATSATAPTNQEAQSSVQMSSSSNVQTTNQQANDLSSTQTVPSAGAVSSIQSRARQSANEIKANIQERVRQSQAEIRAKMGRTSASSTQSAATTQGGAGNQAQQYQHSEFHRSSSGGGVTGSTVPVATTSTAQQNATQVSQQRQQSTKVEQHHEQTTAVTAGAPVDQVSESQQMKSQHYEKHEKTEVQQSNTAVAAPPPPIDEPAPEPEPQTQVEPQVEPQVEDDEPEEEPETEESEEPAVDEPEETGEGGAGATHVKVTLEKHEKVTTKEEGEKESTEESAEDDGEYEEVYDEEGKAAAGGEGEPGKETEQESSVKITMEKTEKTTVKGADPDGMQGLSANETGQKAEETSPDSTATLTSPSETPSPTGTADNDDVAKQIEKMTEAIVEKVEDMQDPKSKGGGNAKGKGGKRYKKGKGGGKYLATGKTAAPFDSSGDSTEDTLGVGRARKRKTPSIMQRMSNVFSHLRDRVSRREEFNKFATDNIIVLIHVLTGRPMQVQSEDHIFCKGSGSLFELKESSGCMFMVHNYGWNIVSLRSMAFPKKQKYLCVREDGHLYCNGHVYENECRFRLHETEEGFITLESYFASLHHLAFDRKGEMISPQLVLEKENCTHFDVRVLMNAQH